MVPLLAHHQMLCYCSLAKPDSRTKNKGLASQDYSNCGSVSWQSEYDLLLRKYGLEGSETGSAKEWKERVHEKNCRDWMEEIEGKSSLKWYQMVKEEAGLEEYTRSLVGQEGVRLRFRLRTGSAGLFEDKKRCRMCDDERCVLCNSCEVEDVEHSGEMRGV